MSRLEELNVKWREILRSPELCPPVLGLAAFSEEEEEEVSHIVRSATSRLSLDELLRHLQRHPAVVLVWLARKAGVAYDENFWPNFEQAVETTIPIPRRDDFVSKVDRHAHAFMANYTPPSVVGTQHLVGTMLFHAGMPLCHCQTFADACRWVESRAGLPDPESLEAGAELRDEILGYPQFQNIPVLRRALAGPAGEYVCAEALNVIFEREGTSTNPRLTAALRDAFANVAAGGLRRSARQPCLRLSADLCALEIVGPRQDASLLAGQSVVWVVNGVPHRRGQDEEFVFRVGDETRVEFELRGLSGGLTCRRAFEFDWAERSVPCLVFDAESRREKRIETPGTATLRSGNYWVVHAAQYSLSESESRYEWPDGRCAISQMTLRPGREVVLEGAPQPMRFHAALTPFFEPTGQIVRTDDVQNIHFGWSQLPEVWCPGGTGELSRWELNIYLDRADSPKVFPLAQGEVQGVFVRFHPAAKEWLDSLAPGLHHLRCVVTRGGRRAECEREFWYWAGLTGWEEGRQFNLSAMPANLHWPDCRGFDRNNGVLRHKADGHRQHRLAFNINGQIESFAWSRTGLFLESYERRAGLATAEEHPIPASFAADVHTARWLRVWHVPAQEAELRVNGQLVQRFAPGQTYAEVSLAHLADVAPQGGSLMLVRHGIEIRIASFHRPLVVQEAIAANAEDQRGLRLAFGERLRWGRVVAANLLDGLVVEYEPHEFTDWPDGPATAAAQCNALSAEILPAEIEYSRADRNHFAVTVRVPSTGWPAGIWVIEFQTRRQEAGAWERVLGQDQCQVPILQLSRPSKVANSFASRVLLAAEMAGGVMAQVELDDSLAPDDKPSACKLLCRLQDLLLVPLPKALRAETFWLERLTESLAGLVSTGLDEAAREDVLPLLQRAANECEGRNASSANERCLFATVPALLALPTKDYAGLDSQTALARSLKWIADLPKQDLLSAVVENRLGFMDMAVWAAFGHQNPSVPNRHGGLNFDLVHYWNQIIGQLHPHDAGNEWLGDAALGRSQAAWAFYALASHYEVVQGVPDRAAELGSVNQLMHRAEEFRDWLSSQLVTELPSVSLRAWQAPWLVVEHPVDFVQSAARFLSLLALASRASAHLLIDFDDVLGWLAEHGDNRRALAWLVTLGPELLGYHLMFWELIIRTSPHD